MFSVSLQLRSSPAVLAARYQLLAVIQPAHLTPPGAGFAHPPYPLSGAIPSPGRLTTRSITPYSTAASAPSM
jgi:hypothetical protein